MSSSWFDHDLVQEKCTIFELSLQVYIYVTK